MEVEIRRQVYPQLLTVFESLGLSQKTLKQVIDSIAPGSPTLSSSPSSRSPHGSSRGSRSGTPTRTLLEQEIRELKADNRRLSENLETLRSQHGMCQPEINNAIMAREWSSKKYRLLVRVTAGLLQKEIDDFPPDEDFDQGLRHEVEEDLRSVLGSPSGTSASSSGRTARPVAGNTVERHPNRQDLSPNFGYSQAAPSDPVPVLSHASSSTSQRSPSSHSSVAGQDGALPTWAIHSGSKCPASVRTIAGPFVKEDFSRLGVDKAELEDLFQGLILPQDVGIRLALGPSPRGLGNVNLLFLYDPFYLESGTRTYILDWVTPQAHKHIVDWLENSGHGDESPVFHTFTLSKKKMHWYYFGGMKWSVAWLNIWPTLEDPESRANILKRLSERSHGALEPEEIERQMTDGQLQELCIEIVSADDMPVVQEIGSRLGRSPKSVPVRVKRAVRGEQ